jgi:uncharacterized damage-inducible protein DinB
MITIPRPDKSEYFEYYDKYIQLVPNGNLLEQYRSVFDETKRLILSLNEEKLNFRYAEGKWSIKEIMMHLADGERVFAYRALRFARKDPTPLAGFDENLYAPESKASSRKIEDIMREFTAIRAASIELFNSFDDEILKRKGIANGKEISVRALAYNILGHELHHVGVIKERYLK